MLFLRDGVPTPYLGMPRFKNPRPISPLSQGNVGIAIPLVTCPSLICVYIEHIIYVDYAGLYVSCHMIYLLYPLTWVTCGISEHELTP